MHTFEILSGRTVLVTGATGLIGKAIVFKLLELGCRVIATVRNGKKANELYGDKVEVIECDVKNLIPQNMEVEYIIHAASNTSSLDFVEKPVDVISDNVFGTRNVLELARINPIQGMVYLSTMEVYGYPETEERIEECHGTNLDPMNIRSSYPESKRLCECLCASYATQYGVPAKVIRLTQTFGPGVNYNDKRVFAEFSRCVIENRDIVLHTDGSTKRSYLFLDDAINAILTVLCEGEVGQAYNAANEDSFCSILEMAQLVVDECAEGQISVLVEDLNNTQSFGYAPKLIMNLSAEKLRQLGWEPEVGLKESYNKLIQYMNSIKKDS